MPTQEPSPTLAAIGEETLVSRSDTVLAAPVRSELVMMSVSTGRYFGLDDIGNDIWQRLETPRTFGALVEALCADYAAERATIAEDVRKLLLEMAAHNVVKIG